MDVYMYSASAKSEADEWANVVIQLCSLVRKNEKEISVALFVRCTHVTRLFETAQ